MSKTNISLEFNGTDNFVELNDGICFLEDSELSEYLKKDKNNSKKNKIIFKKTTQLDTSELLQIKIFIDVTGYFLINFLDNRENRTICEKFVYSIQKKKDLENLENEQSFNKVKLILETLNVYKPLYATFVQKKHVSNSFYNFSDIKLNFPFLVINDEQKELEVTKVEAKKPFIECPFFASDYLFCLLFALFSCFSLHLATSLFSNANLKGIMFFILFLVLHVIMNYSSYLIFYDEKSEFLRGKKLIVGFYLTFGSCVGLIFGTLVGQMYLGIQYNLALTLVDIFVCILCVCVVFESKLFLLFKKK